MLNSLLCFILAILAFVLGENTGACALIAAGFVCDSITRVYKDIATARADLDRIDKSLQGATVEG